MREDSARPGSSRGATSRHLPRLLSQVDSLLREIALAVDVIEREHYGYPRPPGECGYHDWTGPLDRAACLKCGAPMDTRQPGGVPGPESGDIPECAFVEPRAVEWEECTCPHPHSHTGACSPIPYRAPLEGTVPPSGRVWRCATCGLPRITPGGPPDRCAGCGGEWRLVDAPPPERESEGEGP